MQIPRYSPITIQTVFQNGYQIIRIQETLQRGMDLSPLKTCIEQSLAQGRNHIALTLTEDSYLYSETLATLVTYYKMISVQGGSLWLVQANEKILFLLETLGLTDLIRIVHSEDSLPT
jgi:anti-anti-sigma factor